MPRWKQKRRLKKRIKSLKNANWRISNSCHYPGNSIYRGEYSLNLRRIDELERELREI